MANSGLKTLCKNFVNTSIIILEKKIKQGLVVPSWRPLVRTFNSKGGVTATGDWPLIYEFDEILDTLRNEIYSSKEINELIDFILKDGITSTSLMPVPVNDEKQLESIKFMIRYNYLRSFLAEYLNRAGGIKFDEAVFNNLYEEFEISFTSTKMKYISIAPLKNFECETQDLDLGNNLKIRQITEKEFIMLQRLAFNRVNSFSISSLSIHDIVNIKYVIVIEHEANVNTYGGEGKSIEMLTSALRINKAGLFHYDIVLVKPKFWRPMGGIVILGRPETKMLFGNTYTLNVQEVNAFKEFWSSFKIFNFSTYKFLDIAIKRLNDTYDRSKAEDKIIDSFVALEAMFLTGSEKSELSYRLSVRIATFLGNSSEDKNHIFSDIRKAYKTRSEIVHGDSAVNQNDIAEISPKIEEYTRRSLKRFLELLSSKSYGSIIDSIDSNIFT